MGCEVLHLTAHLGGGVGKVLSRVASYAKEHGTFSHRIICLEQPEKQEFVDYALHHGVALEIAPGMDRLLQLVREADIVQLDWWHHPLMCSLLASHEFPKMRLLVWSHVSGIHPPVISPLWADFPDVFLYSSEHSYCHAATNTDFHPRTNARGFVYSSGGFDEILQRPEPALTPFISGYMGTLEFTKLHPNYIDFCQSISHLPIQHVFVGDPTTQIALEQQAEEYGIRQRLSFTGFSNNPIEHFRKFHVSSYLLNPLHYGTTENSMLEMMATGIPVVALRQSTEEFIIQDQVTGFLVDSPKDYAACMETLLADRKIRQRVSSQARRYVSEEMSIDRTVQNLERYYRNIMGSSKRTFDFTAPFGYTPSEWFLSCTDRHSATLFENDSFLDHRDEIPPILTGKSKSSVRQFSKYFPTDTVLCNWINILNGNSSTSNNSIQEHHH